MTRQEMHDHFAEKAEEDGQYAIAWSILQLAEAQANTAYALRPLAHSDLNAVAVKDGLMTVASALNNLEFLQQVASALETRGS